MKPKLLRIEAQFCREPAGRYRTDGDFSGQRFREEYLEPDLVRNQPILVDFDGAEGYGSSFLEEAFGGLVRDSGITAETLHQLLTLKSDEDETIIDEVWGYIDSATPAK